MPPGQITTPPKPSPELSQAGEAGTNHVSRATMPTGSVLFNLES